MDTHNTTLDTTVPTQGLHPSMHATVAEAERITFATWTQPFEVALKSAYDEIAALFPDQSERFIQAVWLQFRRIPKLQACTAESIQAAAVNLALSGLDITQPGEAWLIPHENKRKIIDPKTKKETWTTELECIVWDGYIGRLKLARQAPGVVDVWHDVVREHDTYQFHGTRAAPAHAYPEGFAARGRLQGAYCVVQFADGRVMTHQMSVEEITKHRDQYAKGGGSDVWQEFKPVWENGKKKTGTDENRGFQHMVAKVVICQLCHPRNLAMPRSATQIIGRQDQLHHEARPLTGEDMQPQQPLHANPVSMTEIAGETHSPAKEALLTHIRQDFHAAISGLLPPLAQEALCLTLFGCKQWKDLPHIDEARLTQALSSWDTIVGAVKELGVPAETETWTLEDWLSWVTMGVDRSTPSHAGEGASEQANETTGGNSASKHVEKSGMPPQESLADKRGRVVTLKSQHGIKDNDFYAWMLSQWSNISQLTACSENELDRIIVHLSTYGADAVTRDFDVEETPKA